MKVHTSTPPERVDLGTEVNDAIELFVYIALVLVSMRHLIETLARK